VSTEEIEFSKARLAAIPTPASRIYFKDSKTRGLRLAVLPSGTKSFELYRKAGGKPVRMTLGHFDATLPESRTIPKNEDPIDLLGNAPALNVGMARLMAIAVNAQLDVGINPADYKKATRKAKLEELTLQEAFNKYKQDYLIPQDKRTTDALSDLFDRNLGKVPPGQKKKHGKEKTKSKFGVDWSNRRLSEISAEDVRLLHNRIKEGQSPFTANRVFELLRAIYKKMEEWKYLNCENPCVGISKFKELSRERYLSKDEVPKFFATLCENPNEDFRYYVLLSLFTGGRQSNILGMRWADLDLDLQQWKVHGEYSKNGNPLFIPLSRIALLILETRKQTQPTGTEYVFPAKSRTGHRTRPKTKWTAFLQKADISDFRLHDLRRSLGSYAAMQGISLLIIAKVLGHKSIQSTEVYARLQNETTKDAMNVAGEAILSAGGGIQSLGMYDEDEYQPT
jgi:integrase